MLSHRYVVMM